MQIKSELTQTMHRHTKVQTSAVEGNKTFRPNKLYTKHILHSLIENKIHKGVYLVLFSIKTIYKYNIYHKYIKIS